ncbi:flagellar hook-associated protein FlgK [Methylobacterium sp. 4-46]|uniref:flagellar hook-associated protein FlgK n=1 Tax=unclassified Methylobacterium TaxID=2615210 RepID=UPI000152C4E2|nr:MULTISPECIES: flagellar hook-associated protein FlgK [Methylobacterium]ACA20765.1 flagellar hook-associated protein FlgK [Methylobacterium sp. 4-46]WFT79917.1 flagellar hook-associated protein FlgK [Methylobacterium nodulans]
MGLSLALATARSSLLASSTQIAVSSRNVAGASSAGYSRKIATLVPGTGGVTVSITRASDAALYARMISATSDLAGSQQLLRGLQSLQQTVGDPQSTTSAAARLSALAAALQSAANRPDDATLARAALDKARDLAASLNQAAGAVARTQADADAAMGESVTRISDLLSQFDLANKAVMRGTALGADVTDALDSRDQIIAKLSEELGVTVVPREGGDVALYTDSGVPLYDRIPRKVSFAATPTYQSGTTGNAVIIDGVAVTGPNSPMPLRSGTLAGLSQLRDVAAPAYAAQLDEIASALIATFRETSSSGGADLAGLFRNGSTSALPSSKAGLAAAITLNAAVDPQRGGDPALLRDGGMNGAAYRSNPAAAGSGTAYAGRLTALVAALSAKQSLGSAPGPTGSMALAEYAGASAGWLESQRKVASSTVDQQTTLLGRASDALSNVTGVNTDDETALTLQLERSYQASAKLVTLIDELFKTLMNAV